MSLIDQPIKKSQYNPNVVCHHKQWLIELKEFNRYPILQSTYSQRESLVDFVAKFTGHVEARPRRTKGISKLIGINLLKYQQWVVNMA